MSEKRRARAHRRLRPARAGAGIRVTPKRLQPLGITVTFFVTGLATLALIPLFLWSERELVAAAAVRHPRIVLIVHLYTLGWGTAVALGALQQLSVVVFQAPRARPSLAGWSSPVLYLGGLILFLIGLGKGVHVWTAIGGALLFLSVAAALSVAWRAIRSGERLSPIALAAVPAGIAVLILAVVGVFLAVHFITGILGPSWAATFASHLYLGPLGWFGLLIPGVSYELAPFFGLTRGGDDKGLGRWEGAVVLLLVAGLIAGIASVFAGVFRPLFLLPLGVGYLTFLYDLRGVFRPRPKVRRTATLAGVRFAHAYLGIVALALLAGSIRPEIWSWQVVAAVGWLYAAGWLTNSIAGYLHRILPFLVWHTRNWGKPASEIKTRFQHMVDQDLGRRAFVVYNAGVLAVGAAIALQGDWSVRVVSLGTAVLAAGAWALVFNLIRTLWR